LDHTRAGAVQLAQNLKDELSKLIQDAKYTCPARDKTP
jgi:hypothetical protein